MIDHFDLLATIYDRIIGPPKTDVLRELLRLPINGRLLDCGGGTGRVASQLRPLVRQLVITDLSQPMLKQAQAKGGIYPMRSHAERLPFADENFDRVLVVDALHHFCDQKKAIGEFIRVLKPKGRLVVEEPDISRFVVKLVALAEKLTLMRSHFHSAVEIENMITFYGLSAQIRSDGRFEVWIIVDK